MSQAEDFLQEIGQDGRLESEGVFSFDAKAAFRKLKEFRVHDVNEYGLFFVRGLVTSGAKDIQLHVDSDDFEIRFQGGKLSPQALDQLASGLLDDSWFSKYLMWGVETCRSIGMCWVRIHLEKQCWEFGPDKLLKFASDETALIHVKRNLGLEVLNRFWRKETPEVDLILSRYRHFAQELRCNGVVADPQPFSFQPSLLAKVVHGSAAAVLLDPNVSAQELEPSLPPPADVLLLISCPLAVAQPSPGQNPASPEEGQNGGLCIFLGGAFQERISTTGLNWPFEILLSVDGIELDLSLNHVMRGRSLERWIDWIRHLELPLFEMLCQEQLRSPSAGIAACLADKAAQLMRGQPSPREENLLSCILRAPLFVTGLDDILTLQGVESAGRAYYVSSGETSRYDRFELSRSYTRQQRSLILLSGKAERELLLNSKNVVLEDVRKLTRPESINSANSYRFARRTTSVSRANFLGLFSRANSISFAEMEVSSQLYVLGPLVLDGTAKTFRKDGLMLAIQEPTKFEVYTHTRSGNSIYYHYVLIRIETSQDEVFYGDRGKQHSEWDADFAQEFHRFRENFRQFLQAAKWSGATLVSID